LNDHELDQLETLLLRLVFGKSPASASIRRTASSTCGAGPGRSIAQPLATGPQLFRAAHPRPACHHRGRFAAMPKGRAAWPPTRRPISSIGLIRHFENARAAATRPVAVVLPPPARPVGCRGARPSAPARAPYPPTLDQDAHHLPRRRPLCPARGDGMVRGNHIDYVFGLPGSKPLSKKIDEAADAGAHRARFVRTSPSCAATPKRAIGQSWSRERPRRRPHRSHSARARHSLRRHQRRIRRGPNGSTNAFYCARGQAENLIKLHKSSFASDRTSCRSAIAIRSASRCTRRLTGSMLTVRDAIPKPRDLANAEFSTLRLRLIKIAPASSKPRAASVSLSPPAARRPTSSRPAGALARSDPERRGKEPSALVIPPTVRKSIGRQA